MLNTNDKYSMSYIGDGDNVDAVLIIKNDKCLEIPRGSFDDRYKKSKSRGLSIDEAKEILKALNSSSKIIEFVNRHTSQNNAPFFERYRYSHE